MARNLEKHELELVARAAHEVNRTWSMAISGPVDPVWDELTEEQKKSARLGVLAVVEHDFTAEQSHAAWLTEKRADGWTYGAKKSLLSKEHDCLVPYDSLPLEYQAKDELWVDTVRSFVRHFWRIPVQ